MGIHTTELAKYVIKPVLENLELYSLAAEQLLLGTAAQESQLGHYLHQQQGPALGIYQIEPATHKDLWENYLAFRPKMQNKVLRLLPPNCDKDNELIGNLSYATAIARLIYQRVPATLPPADNIEALANYWKKYYNTPLGKGTAEEFITNYYRYVQMERCQS